jgi:predicted nucleotidyltransferase
MNAMTTKEAILSTIAAHKEELQRNYGVTRIGVFGSYARGDAAQTSDVDVVVELAMADLFNLINIKQVLEKALGKNVDLVRMRKRMSHTLKRRIEQDAVYV